MVKGLYGISGSTTVLEKLSEYLLKRGVDVTVGALKFKRQPPIKVKTLNIGIPPNVRTLKNLLQDFDIIHNHHPIMNYLALISRRPFVYHYHGAPEFGRRYLFRFSMLLSIKLVNHAFDAVIAVSESGAMELKRYFSLNNVHVIYNGVDTNRFKHGLDERFRKGTPQFLFVGNLYEHKKVEELILALKELVKTYPKAHLQIVGGGYTYAKLQSLVVKLNLQDHVTVIGRVPDSDLPYYYVSCDVYTTASRYEVCPVPLLEAMACGKPVVASSIPPHVELITKSKAGTTYTEGDMEGLCKKMIKTYEESDKYRSNALHFAKEHDWSAVADRVLRIYTQIGLMQ